MGRGVSSGGGQSSLGYLFGSDAPPPTKPVEKPEPPPQVAPKVAQPAPPAAAAQTEGQASRNSNNYHRADGQNSGNFITDRPSTKVHSAPGGGSSLGYLFGGQK
jgi:SPIRAL1-like protein